MDRRLSNRHAQRLPARPATFPSSRAPCRPRCGGIGPRQARTARCRRTSTGSRPTTSRRATSSGRRTSSRSTCGSTARSTAYLLGDKMDPAKVTHLNYPRGDRNDKSARIMPFKMMQGKQPYDSVNNVFAVPNLWGGYWAHWDWNKAIADGMKAAGLAIQRPVRLCADRHVLEGEPHGRAEGATRLSAMTATARRQARLEGAGVFRRSAVDEALTKRGVCGSGLNRANCNRQSNAGFIGGDHVYRRLDDQG